MRPFVLFSSTFFKIFITSLLLFHSHFRIRNIIKWPTSLPMLGNKYQLPISPISILSRSTRPREKREGGKNSRDECPSPTSRRADHGTMKWSSRHVLVTALLRTSDITISLWLMQTFVQIAGNVLSHPSPLPPLSVVPTNASYAVHTCARRCNERVCKCVCHDYTSSSSVCNCSPFVPPSGEEAKSGVALERDSLWILLDQRRGE